MNRNQKAQIQILYLLISAVLCVLAFGFLLPKLPSSPMLKEEFWVSKVSQKKQYDIVYTGDSRIYRGIDPNAIDKVLNCQSFNFGFSSAGLDSLLLNSAADLLKEEGRKILLVGVSANAFMPSSLKNEHLRQYLKLSKADKFLRTEMYAQLRFFDSRAVSDLYKYIKGEAYYEVFYPHSGFVASDKLPADSSSALAAYQNQFEHEEIESAALENFLDQLRILQKKGLRIVLLRMPVSYSMKRLEDKYTNNFCDTLLFRAKDLGVKIIDVQDLKVESYDGSHLSSRSAALLSSSIADAIQQMQF